MLGLDLSPANLLVIAIFLGIGFPVHEFSHALAAYQLGDGTAKVFGRLTLNPVKHFDPIGGLLFIVTALLGSGFVFGWAKPTPVNPSNLRDRRNGEVIVALAGPASNLIMACLGALLFRALAAFWVGAPTVLVEGLEFFVLYNLMLGLFNLVPIPPLDGSTVLFRFLDPATAWRLRVTLAQYGFVVLLLAVFLLGGQIGNLLIRATAFLLGM